FRSAHCAPGILSTMLRINTPSPCHGRTVQSFRACCYLCCFSSVATRKRTDDERCFSFSSSPLSSLTPALFEFKQENEGGRKRLGEKGNIVQCLQNNAIPAKCPA